MNRRLAPLPIRSRAPWMNALPGSVRRFCLALLGFWCAPRAAAAEITETQISEILPSDAPVTFLLLGGILILLGVLCVTLLSARRRAERYGRIVKRLPLEFFVFGKNDRILMFNDGENLFSPEQKRRFRTLDDLPSEPREAIRTSLRRVRGEAGIHYIDYEYATRRSAFVEKLDDGVFGERAYIWISQNTDALQKAKEEAELNAEQFKLTLHAIGDGVIVTDARGGVTMMNSVAEALSGWSVAEAVGRDSAEVLRLCSYTDDSPVPSPVRMVLETGNQTHLANHTDVIARDGTRRHIADSAAPIRGRGGDLLGVVLVFRDVTEEYEKRDALHAIQELVEYGAELTRSAAFRTDLAGRNCLGTRLLPEMWPLRDGVLAPPEEWVCAEDLPEFRRTRKQLLDGEIQLAELTYRSVCGGSMRYYRGRVTIDRGNPLNPMLLGVIQDVTDSEAARRRMLALNSDLENTSAIFQALMDNMPCYVVAKDMDDGLRYTLCNKLFCKMTGLTEERVIGHFEHEFFTKPEEIERFRTGDFEAIHRNVSTEQVMPFTGADGELRTGHAYRFPLRFADGRHWLFMMVDDITGIEKERRDAARQAEWLRMTLNSIGDGVIATDAHGKVMLLNPVASRMIGVPSEAAAGKPHEEVFRIVSALDDHPMTSPVTRSIRTGNTVELANHTDLLSFSGKRYHIADSSAPIFDAEHRIAGAILVFRDVTEEYLQRNNLRVALSQFEAAAELTRTASFRIDPDTREISGSKLLPELWPLRDGLAVPLSEWVHPDDLPELQERRKEFALGADGVKNCSYRSIRNGEIRYFRMSVMPDRSDPHKLQFCGVIQDITEITRREEKFRETMELWKIVLGLIPVMIFAKRADDHFRYTLANKAFEDFTGRTEEEILGRCDSEIFNRPEDLEWFEECDGAVMREGGAKTISEDVVGADGRPHSFRTTKMPFRDAEGRPLLLAVSFDVTELNALIGNLNVLNSCLEIFFRAESPSEAIRQVLENIAEHMGASHAYVFRIDLAAHTADTVMEFARRDCEPLGAGLKNFPFDPDEECIRILRENRDGVLPDLRDPVQGGVIRSWDKFYTGKNIRSLFFTGIRRNGKLWGNLGVVYTGEPHKNFSDLDLQFLHAAAHLIEMLLERERTADKLRLAVEQARAADRAKSMFLASMSHEIRTPLNAVIGFSELLQDGSLPEAEQKECLTSISAAGNALLSLINDVLDLSKLEAGRMVFTPSDVDFRQLIHEIHTIFKQKCAEKQLEFAEESDGVLPVVRADKLRLRQILFNLVGNAVKFTSAGRITIRAGFVPESDGVGTLTFHVTDTGQGIAESDRKRLFQMFVQAAPGGAGNRADNAGTGLGLAICKRLIEQMNGEIRLDSEPGKGSDFTVILRGVPYLSGAGRYPGEGDRGAAGAAPERGADFSKLRVLVVDDVPMNLRVQSALLRKLGVEVVTSNDASDALAKLREQRFDAVLADLWMPGMNGAELAGKIRAESLGGGAKIVAATADTEGGASFDMSVFDAVLTKPVTLEKMTAVLNRCVGAEENPK